MLENVQIFASLAVAAMSTIVAIAASIFSYRRNVGWKPVGLVAGSSMSGQGGKSEYKVELSLEFWNRRNYPVVIRSIVAEIDGAIVKDSAPVMGISNSYVRSQKLYKKGEITVEPTSCGKVKIKFDLAEQSLDAAKPLVEIKIAYFDPHKSKTCQINMVHKFFYPELGWKKTEAERQAARDNFKKLKGMSAEKLQSLKEAETS